MLASNVISVKLG